MATYKIKMAVSLIGQGTREVTRDVTAATLEEAIKSALADLMVVEVTSVVKQ